MGASVVIPSWGESRSGNVQKLLDDLQKQTLKPSEVQVIRNIAPNGRARNAGAARTSGEVLVFIDDDVRLGNEQVVERLVRALDEHCEFGLVGTSQLIPPESSRFQRSLAHQLSRTQSPVVSDYTDSDMATTACCAIRREVFERLGGFHEGLVRGVDPEFRHRLRRLGLRIVIVPNSWHYHPVPASLPELLRFAFRDGSSSARVFREYPEAILNNPEGHSQIFEARTSRMTRYWGRIMSIVKLVATRRWLGALYGGVYVAGYIWTLLFGRFEPGTQQTVQP